MALDGARWALQKALDSKIDALRRELDDELQKQLKYAKLRQEAEVLYYNGEDQFSDEEYEIAKGLFEQVCTAQPSWQFNPPWQSMAAASSPTHLWLARLLCLVQARDKYKSAHDKDGVKRAQEMVDKCSYIVANREEAEANAKLDAIENELRDATAAIKVAAPLCRRSS